MVRQHVACTLLALPAPALGAPPPIPDRIDFRAQIQPILEARCYACHGPGRQRADLRLDRKAGVFGGEPSEWVIRPGDAAGSELFRRISLPDDDLDRMPGEGEPLEAGQIALVRDWIDQGAVWPDDSGGGTEDEDEIVLPEPSDEQKAAERAALAAIRARRGLVMPIAADSRAVEVNLSMLGAKVGDSDLELLAGLEPIIVWLNLGGTSIGDAGAARLERFKELRWLYLQRTKIGDEALRHLGGLPRLRYLNLYQTDVTDAGLAHLRGLARLRRLYLWRTRVTDEGVEELQRAIPDLTIVRGDFRLATAGEPADTQRGPPPACCAAAQREGKTCDHPCCVESASRGATCQSCPVEPAPPAPKEQ